MITYSVSLKDRWDQKLGESLTANEDFCNLKPIIFLLQCCRKTRYSLVLHLSSESNLDPVKRPSSTPRVGELRFITPADPQELTLKALDPSPL